MGGCRSMTSEDSVIFGLVLRPAGIWPLEELSTEQPTKPASMSQSNKQSCSRRQAGVLPSRVALCVRGSQSSREAILSVQVVLFLGALLSAIAAFPPLSWSQASLDTLKADAAAARDRGDVPTAIQLYTQVTTADPGWPDGWWFLGTLLYSADQYVPAREALSHYIDRTPDAAAAIALRGLCEFELGQYPESLADIQNGIELGAAAKPKNAQILLYHEALLLTRLGRFEEAIAKYTVFVKQGVVGDEVATSIGLAGLRMARFPKDVDPEQAAMIAATGQSAIRFMSGDTLEAFTDSLRQYPNTPNLHYFYGYLLFPTAPTLAVQEFERELQVVPGSAVAHAMLAWSSSLRGDFAEALPNAQKAALEDPSMPMAQLVLGRALVGTGELTDGLTHLQRVLQTDPQNLEAHLSMVRAYSKLGRKAEARRERLLCLELSGQGGAPVATP